MQERLQRKILEVQPATLVAFWRSKFNIYSYFSEKKQKLLPSYRATKKICIKTKKTQYILNLAFLQQVLKNEKNLLNRKDVINLQVPHLKELSVKNIFPKVSYIEEVNQYLPEEKDNKYPESDFFYLVVGTLMKDWLLEQIKYVLDQRNQGKVDELKGDFIEFDEELLNELQNNTFISKNLVRDCFSFRRRLNKEKCIKLAKILELKKSPHKLTIKYSNEEKCLTNNRINKDRKQSFNNNEQCNKQIKKMKNCWNNYK